MGLHLSLDIRWTMVGFLKGHTKVSDLMLVAGIKSSVTEVVSFGGWFCPIVVFKVKNGWGLWLSKNKNDWGLDVEFSGRPQRSRKCGWIVWTILATNIHVCSHPRLKITVRDFFNWRVASHTTGKLKKANEKIYWH